MPPFERAAEDLGLVEDGVEVVVVQAGAEQRVAVHAGRELAVSAVGPERTRLVEVRKALLLDAVRSLCAWSGDEHECVNEPLNSARISLARMRFRRTEKLEFGTGVGCQAVLARQALEDRTQVAARAGVQNS